jgi:pSer/pThr/pTyr-binding forkhead associated (FHA) protein
MTDPTATLVLPDGTVVRAGPDAIVGRSSHATVRVDDARVSTVHAELSWRAEGFVLIARGGRLAVGGRALREVVLSEGLEVALAPHVVLKVARIERGDAPVVAPTAGRERLRVTLGDDVRISVVGDEAPLVHLVGVSARIVAELARRRGAGVAWDAIATAVWPEDGAIRSTSGWTDTDERRLRNRWDQQLVSLRRQLEVVRGGDALSVRGGVVELRLASGDEVVES